MYENMGIFLFFLFECRRISYWMCIVMRIHGFIGFLDIRTDANAYRERKTTFPSLFLFLFFGGDGLWCGGGGRFVCVDATFFCCVFFSK
ncbi:hypothetical protein BC832DRAFT_569438 [Gaertneriomyces semiglobifer]|nr:hypothetical protein BC832DRAFT_569438 [Gaertneriomyces semiglobifer]